MVTVFLVDDHEVVRRGLIDLLSTDPELDVIGEAGSVAHAMAQIPALRPDVAVLDVRLPDGARVCAAVEPIAVGGTAVAIRRHRERVLPLAAFTTHPDVAGLLDYHGREAGLSQAMQEIEASKSGADDRDIDLLRRTAVR